MEEQKVSFETAKLLRRKGFVIEFCRSLDTYEEALEEGLKQALNLI